MREDPILLDVRTGRPVLRNGHRTAYGKESRLGPVLATALGLEGDAVGNRRVHGGPDKAVYAYAARNYPAWMMDHPRHAAILVAGAFGENLLVDGLDETEVCIGDQWRVGEALLEPCQPRQPCATLARWFDDPQMVKAMVRNGRAGWYCRVLQPGLLQRGDRWRLEHRPAGAWTVADVLQHSYVNLDRERLVALASAPGLAESWAHWAATQAVADAPRAKPL